MYFDDSFKHFTFMNGADIFHSPFQWKSQCELEFLLFIQSISTDRVPTAPMDSRHQGNTDVGWGGNTAKQLRVWTAQVRWTQAGVRVLLCTSREAFLPLSLLNCKMRMLSQ